MDAIERLRLELGQRVLTLAASDPVLDRAVSMYADGIAAILSESATVDGAGDQAGVVDLPGLRWYAQRFSADGREIDRLGLAGNHWGRSLTAAAICRLADRLSGRLAPPAGQPAPTGAP